MDNKIVVTVEITDDQNKYLKSNGFNRSKFMRQAIEAQKAGSWCYQFLKF